MIQCPGCKEFVEMVNDSRIDEDEDKYTIYLECPKCFHRLVGDVKIADLDHLPPMEM